MAKKEVTPDLAGGNIIRPLFKAREPFQESKSGHGYIGVLMYNEADDTIQCHECGEFFKALGAHIKSHSLSADAYRLRHGLNLNIALCGRTVAAMRRDNIKRQFFNHKKSRPKPMGRASPKRQHGTKAVSYQNKFGLCDLQMKTRYEIVRSIVGKMPTEAELRKHDHALYSAIERRFGTLNTFRVSIGERPMTTAEYHMKPDFEIIGALRSKAMELERPPTTRDFAKAAKGSPHYDTILKRFGGWKTALHIAGIPEMFNNGLNRL